MVNDNLNFSSENTITEMMGTKESSGWYRYCWYEDDLGKSLCESTNWDDISEGF